MTLDTHYKKIQYLKQITDHLTEFYGTKDIKSKPYERLKNRLDGFIQAGLLVGLLTKVELQKLIDLEHMNAFGMTRKQRQAESQIDTSDTKVNWDVYDTPTIHRK